MDNRTLEQENMQLRFDVYRLEGERMTTLIGAAILAGLAFFAGIAFGASLAHFI